MQPSHAILHTSVIALISNVWFQITYLRRFPNLKTLNLSNNPFCEFDNYKLYVAAFLPHLDFLDYRILDEKTVYDP